MNSHRSQYGLRNDGWILNGAAKRQEAFVKSGIADAEYDAGQVILCLRHSGSRIGATQRRLQTNRESGRVVRGANNDNE